MSAIGRSTMLPPSRRAVRVGVALRRKRRRVERSSWNRIGGVEVVAALQTCHAVRAVEMIDDMAEIQLVDRWLRGAVVVPVNTQPIPDARSESRCATRPTRNAQVSSESSPGALLRASSTQRSPCLPASGQVISGSDGTIGEGA